MIKTILWDFDNTLLDFEMAERNAIISTFKAMGLGDINEKMLRRYSEINMSFWQKIERKEIDKKLALVKRYEVFFEEIGIDKSFAFKFNEKYEIALCDTIEYLDDSYNIVKSLKGHYQQCITSNGAIDVQKLRIKKSKFDTLMDHIFISDEIKADKPSMEFFNYVIDVIKCDDRSEVLIVGDSLTSDIKGGNNAGFLTCWYNKKNNIAPSDYKIDYNIQNLNEIYNILMIDKNEY